MTPLPRAISLLLISSFLLGWTATGIAQTNSPAEMMMRDKPPVVPPPPDRSAEVEELSLPTYYLEDDSGQLVPVLKRMTYEEWETLYKAKLELANPDVPPRYTLDSLKLSGEVVGETVEFTADVELAVMATGWIKVPLRLSRAALQKPLECAENEQCFLEYDQDGYILWLRLPPPAAEAAKPVPAEGGAPTPAIGKPPLAVAVKPWKFRLHMSAPLTAKGGEHELQLDLPRKVVASELTLLVNDAVTVTPPPMAKMTRESAGDGHSRVKLVGVAGDLRLRWSEPVTAAAAAEVDVHSLVLTEIGGPRAIKSTARLRLRSLNGPLRQFSVLLPPGMQLLAPTANETFRVLPLAEGQMATANDRQRITIELLNPTSEQIEVTLAASGLRPQQEQYTQFEIAGFEVPEAKLQSGYHALAVEGDWYLYWSAENNNLRQIDVLDPTLEAELTAWKAKNVIARFHCISFPTILHVRVTPQRSLIQVEPNYRVSISENQLTLDATLNYRVRGRKLELLELELGDWSSAVLAPESLVRLEAVVNENGVYSIPLQQPTGGDFTLKVRATQKIEAPSGDFSFTLPRLRTSQPEREQLTTSLAALAVVAADNVMVSPLIDQIVGLSPEAAGSSMEFLPDYEQPPRLYRQRSDSTALARFAGRLQVMPQSVAVVSRSHVAPVAGGFEVDVRLQYTVKHVPLEWLEVEVPAALLSLDDLKVEFLLDGVPIEPTQQPLEAGQMPKILFTLPEARRKAFELHAKYTWMPPAVDDPQQATKAEIPLVRPAIDFAYASSASELTLSDQDLVRIADTTLWKPAVASEADQPAEGGDYRSAELPAIVSLQRLSHEGESLRRTNVKLAWFQSWLNATQRRDRAVFNVEAAHEKVDLQLPDGIDPDELTVMVDRNLVSIQPSQWTGNVLHLPLPPKPENQYVIELMYQVAQRPSSQIWQGGLARFRFPQLIGGEPERVYWQLVLPSNEYLWLEPAGVTAETQWSVPAWLAPARPTVEQRQLEEWSEATHTPPPAVGANVYLFSGFGQIDHLTTGLVQRRALVLLGAGLVLALALPLIYLPSLRGWKALVAAGLVLLLLGLAFPYPAQLIGSSVIAGCLLVLLARFLQITLSSRRQAPRILPPRDGKLSPVTQHGYTLDAPGSSHGTTATAPAIYASSLGKQEVSS